MLLLTTILLTISTEASAQCNFKTEYTSPFSWQANGSSISVSGGQLNFNQTPGAPLNEYLYRQLPCTLNDDNWQAQFSFQLDTGNLMGHAILYLGDQNANPSVANGIGAYVYSDGVGPDQLVLVTKYNANFSTSLGSGLIAIEQDSTYHIVLERTSVGSARLSVYRDSLLSNQIPGSPINMNFSGTGIIDLDYVIHGNNSQLPGVDFLDASIQYLNIIDGCSAEITGIDTLCSGKDYVFQLNESSSYQWNTGQGSKQITMSFASDQLLIGTITDTNACSASDTLDLKVFGSPNASFNTSGNSSSSIPYTVNFFNNSTSANKWFWYFGDGATSNQENPSHTYNSFGNFEAQLVAMDSTTGCTDTFSRQIAIISITADFASEATSGCGPTVIQFEDLSTGTITNWFWVFGNGSISTDQNPVAIYPNPGTYNVSLTVTDGFNSDTKTIIGYILIGPESAAPVVQFVADTTSSCTNNLQVQFTDLSTNAVSWLWDFGDGDTSHMQNPTHNFDSAGYYSVNLQVTNSIGCVRDTTYSNYIVVDPPRADYVASPSNACGPFSTTFQDLSYAPDTIVSWYWVFGDGQNSIQENPTHLYATTGVYIASLTVEDKNGCSDTYTDTIRSGSIKPDADFTANPPVVCIGESVQFTDQSLNANQWFWDFGDGTPILTQQNPVHSFADTGFFSITLIACNDGCCDTTTLAQNTRVREPIADFSMDEPIGCSIPHTIQFTDESYSPSTWYWDFGDGTNSIQQNPSHTYTQIGIYQVMLTVQDNVTGCTDTFSSQVNIDTARTNFAAFPLSGCTPLMVQFADNSRNPISFLWDFGNGVNSTVKNPNYTYTDSGSYNITLVTEVQNGCKDTLTRASYINAVEPDIQINASVLSGCVPLTVDFQDLTTASSSRRWDFGNGDTSILKSPQVTFDQPGIYDITIEVQDFSGCSQTKIYSQYIEVFGLPSVSLSNDTAVCFGSAVDLFVTGAQNYNWSNGLSGDSIQLNITKDSLLVVNATDSNTCAVADTVAIQSWALPVADAGINDSVCLGESGTLIATGGSQYLWSNNTNTAQLSVTVASTTLFSVEVTDTNSCVAVDSAYIVVRPQPIVDAGVNDTICFGDIGGLNGSGSGSLVWSNGNTGASLIDSPAVSTQYILEVTDNYTCTNTDTASIIVEYFTNAGIVKPDTICVGDTAMLEAFGGVSYLWSNSEITSQINVTPAVNTLYKVTVTNAQGCVLIDSVEVVVNPITNLNIPDANFCLGGYTILDANVGSGGSYTWSTGSSTDTIVVNAAGTYTVIAENSFGCLSFDTVEVDIDTVLAVNLLGDSICDGQVLTLNAGNPGTTYNWNTNDTTQTLLVNQSGTYSVTVTDPFGCIGMDSTDVLFYPRPVADAGENDTICLGESSLLIASGGIDYQWSDGVLNDSNLVAPSVSLTYSVIVTDQNSCADTAEVEVIVDPLPPVNAGSDIVLCENDTANLLASGADSYMWSNGVSQAANTLIAYQDSLLIVEGFDVNGCSAFDSVFIQVNSLPVANAETSDSICPGETAMLIATGGDFYNWSNLSSNDSIFVSPVVTTTYSVTVSDSAGCSNVDSVDAIVYPVPVANAGSDVSVCIGDSALLSASGGDSYLWSNGETSSSIKVAPSSSQSYWVEVFNSFSCSSKDTVVVTVNPLPVLNLSPDTSVCVNSPVELNASGAINYNWSTGESGASITVNVTTDTTISVVGTDANTCTNTDTVEILSAALPVLTVSNDTAVCAGSPLLLEATGAASFEWSTGAMSSSISVNPLNTTTYRVTATNGANCQLVAEIEVETYSLPQFQLSDQTFCTGGGTTLPGPTGNFEYLWSTGDTSQNLFVSISDAYYLSVTDSNLCSFTDTAIVSDSSVLVMSISDQNICNGQLAILDAAYPAASHQWNTGDTTQSIVIDTAGIFTVLVQDSFGCEGRDTVEVKLYQNPIVSLGPDTAYCSGTLLNLSHSILGTSIWNSSDTTSVYSYTTTFDTTITLEYIDTNACVAFDTLNLQVNHRPSLNVLAPDSACQNSEITLSAIGSNSVVWFNSDTTLTTQTILNQSSYFSATVSDSNACITIDSVFVKALPLPFVDAGVDSFVCYRDSIELFGNSSLVDYQYWSTGDSSVNVVVAPLTRTNFLYTVVDSNTCVASDTVLIEVSQLPAITFKNLKAKYCFGDTIAVLDIQPSGGQLTGLGVNGFTFNPNVVPFDSLITLRYEITDTFGCFNAREKSTIVYPLPEPELNIVDTGFCADLTPVSLLGSPFGGRFRGPGVSNDIFIPFYAGAGRHLLQYVFADSNQCVAADSQYVTVYPLPEPVIDTLPEQVCIDGASLSVDLSPEGGVLQGIGLQGDTLFVPSLAGVGGPYPLIYTVTDSNNCVNFTYHEISVNALPVLNFNGLLAKYCYNVDTVNLMASPVGGYFSGTGVDSTISKLIFDTSFTQSTVYYHFYDSLISCGNVISKQVRKLAETPVSFVNAVDTFCSNTEYVLLEASPAGGVFSGTNVRNSVFRPSALATDSSYEVYYTYTDVNSCVSIDTASYYLRALPEVQILNQDSIFCDGEIELLGMPLGGYYSGMGQYNGVLYPEEFEQGIYNITYSYSDEFGCVTFVSRQFQYIDCTDIDEISNVPVRIYPNPFNSEIFIDLRDVLVQKIQVYSLQGSVVFEQELEEHNSLISINSLDFLQSGVYIIKLNTPDGAILHKLTKLSE